jgi:hypothetical protein
VTITAARQLTSTIADVRQMLYGLVAGLDLAPTYRWLPQEANETPCYVIGRPDVVEGAQRALLEISTPVYAIGRTAASRDDDSQSELDDLADALLGLLWTPPQAVSISLRLTTLAPTVVLVAATEYPAYTATVVAGTAYC